MSDRASGSSLCLAPFSLLSLQAGHPTLVDDGLCRVPSDPVFTGIVQETGLVTALEHSPGGHRVRVDAPGSAGALTVGASVAVNGACLTAVDVDATGFVLDVVPETLARTNLDALAVGARVNLELAMRADGRFDGHIVQGHVDAVGVLSRRDADGADVRFTVDVPEALARYVVEKGSITIDGVSLTVADVDPGAIQVALIPHTLERTTLGERVPGDRLNLEADVLAKYVERLMAVR